MKRKTAVRKTLMHHNRKTIFIKYQKLSFPGGIKCSKQIFAYHTTLKNTKLILIQKMNSFKKLPQAFIKHMAPSTKKIPSITPNIEFTTAPTINPKTPTETMVSKKLFFNVDSSGIGMLSIFHPSSQE